MIDDVEAQARDLERALDEAVLRSWSDPPERGRSEDDWPYPDAYVESSPPDSLRAAILARLGRETGEVVLRTVEVSGGYSEYTQENDFSVTVLVDDAEVYETETTWDMEGALVQLLTWLDARSAPERPLERF